MANLFILRIFTNITNIYKYYKCLQIFSIHKNMKAVKSKNQTNKWTKTMNRQNMGKDKQVFLKYTERTSALLRIRNIQIKATQISFFHI